MSISICDVHTDETGKDDTSYGTREFPVSCYLDDLYEMNVNLHWHKEFEFIHVTEGNVYVQAGNKKLLLEKGSAVFINSEILHSAQRGNRSSSVLKSVVFDSALVADFPESVFYRKYILPFKNNDFFEYRILKDDIDWQKEIIELMDSAWNDIVNEPASFENSARFYITQSLHVLVENIQEELKGSVVSQKQILSSSKIKKLLEFINQNYMNEICLEQLCALVNISESSCLRLFKDFTGKTPLQYVKLYRLEKADELLKSTELTVTEAALNCGFNDISYFIKSYRELYGKTPGFTLPGKA